MSRIKKLFQLIIDGRYSWVLRYYLYKSINKNIKGNGYFGKPIFISGFNNISIESNFGIFPGGRIEVEKGKLIIKSGVRIGHNILIDNSSKITIKENVVISANVYIGSTKYIIHNDRTGYKDWNIEGKNIVIGSNSFIGFGAVILPGTILGDYCVVGANAVANGIYPDGSVISAANSKIMRSRFE